MAIKPIKMVWVTVNSRPFVGGPKIGFTLEADQCYQIPENLAMEFLASKWVVLGKERRKRVVLKK